MQPKLAGASGGKDYTETVWARSYVLRELSVIEARSSRRPRRASKRQRSQPYSANRALNSNAVPPSWRLVVKRRKAGETLATIAKSYGVDISMISRLSASAQADELVALADEKGSPLWKAFGARAKDLLLP